MTKQLDDMWSSRWVLPEHREALINDDRSLKRKTRPELDEQEVLIIDQAIYRSLKQKRVVTLNMFDEWEHKTFVGIVIQVVAGLKQIKLEPWDQQPLKDECIWLSMKDILKAEVKEVETWDEGNMDW
jgi:hypothetical protein